MKLYHPLWTHSAAFVLLGVVAAVLWASLSVPGEFPVHWTWEGRPDRFGPAWELPMAFLFGSLLVLAISVAVDGLRARDAGGKRLSLLSLLDEMILGQFAAAALVHLGRIRGEPFAGHWVIALGLYAVAVPVALLLEWRRPAPPSETPAGTPLPRGDEAALGREVAERQKAGQPWAYWESQNPGWTRWGMPVLIGGLLALAVREWHAQPWLVVVIVPAVLLGLGACGGLRVRVTRTGLAVRAGYLGWPLLRLGHDQVASAEVHAFSPIRDFGGWGLRINREMKAFFLQGDRGVKLTTRDGRRYLVGSDHPERLAAVIQAAKAA